MATSRQSRRRQPLAGRIASDPSDPSPAKGLVAAEGAGNQRHQHPTMSTTMSTTTTIIVTRHPGFLSLAIERGLCPADTTAIPHANAETLVGSRVITSGLPLHLAALCSEIITIPLNLPPSLRGAELNLEQCRAHAGPTATFMVIAEPKGKTFMDPWHGPIVEIR